MAQILVTKPGAVSLGDRAALRSDGIIVVETDNPADVKMLGPDGAEIGAGGLLFAAIKALNSDVNYVSEMRASFVGAVLAEMEAEREAKKALPRDEHGRFAKRTGA
jgi:hypothetical protein